jgi:hypothetical protein
LRKHAKPLRASVAREDGIALLEVLIAIFMMGVGLLTVLTLFPLGALELAQAVEDNRTAAIAANADALSQSGKDLLSRTADFVMVSLAGGSADPKVLAQLRDDYAVLELDAAHLEQQLLEVKSLLPRPIVQPHVARLLAQIRAIRHRIDNVVRLLEFVDSGHEDK